MAPAPSLMLFYFVDPMCSWCWGFLPVVRAIGAAAKDRAATRLVVGGLRVGQTQPLDEEAKAVIRHHWQEVEKTTGQPFSYAFFEREGFVYDTEAACRAVVAMRSFAPGATLAYLEAVQKAFYVDNRDVTDPPVLADIAATFDVDVGAFSALFAAREIVDATRADFQATASVGVTGFPTVILRKGEAFSLLTAGYQPFESLKPQLDRWLAADE